MTSRVYPQEDDRGTKISMQDKEWGCLEITVVQMIRWMDESHQSWG